MLLNRSFFLRVFWIPQISERPYWPVKQWIMFPLFKNKKENITDDIIKLLLEKQSPFFPFQVLSNYLFIYL